MQVIKRSFIAFLLVLSVLCSSCFALAKTQADGESSGIELLEIQSNRHTMQENETKASNRLTLENYEKMLENSSLEIWFNSSLDSLRIVDKSNGYIWGGLPDEDGTGLNSGWKNFANSLCSIEYFNSNASESRLSISESDVKSFYEWDDTGFLCTFNASKIGIVFDFKMTLNDYSVSFEVVEDSLQENGDARLKSLYFIPFMGSTYQDEINGYTFIPDGCGALIRFSKSSSYVTGFEGKVYGLDGSIDSLAPAGTLQANRINEYLVEPYTVTVPVFGVAHGSEQNAFFGVIENGCEYTSVVASPAGVVTDYNWASARFDYRQLYTKIISGSGIPVIQETANNMCPKLTFYFLNGQEANYSGMANTYRKLLIEKGVLNTEKKDTDIPLRLEFVGSTVKKGFIFNRVKTLTKPKEAIEIIDKLGGDGIENMTVVYRGWQKGSTDKSTYGKLKISSNRGLNKLNEAISANGSSLYLYLDPVLANEKQVYKPSDTAIGIDESFISRTSANRDQMFSVKYYAKISRILDVLKLTDKKFGTWNFAFDSLGGTVYSDYSKKNSYSRTESIAAITQALEAKEKVALYNPNVYCWKYTDDYFNIPVNNSQFQYETDTVPFLQMVLKGSVDYYSDFLNQGYCSESTILKLVEYGVYPSYITMAADNYSLSNTAISDYFSICFDDWEDEILSVYEKVNKALSVVEGCYITEHKALYDGVVRVTYSNGTVIYVNYLSEAVTVDGKTIEPEQFLICSE